MIAESFQSQPLQSVVKSYLYEEYSDDADLQAFVDSQNALAQGYLDWFNATPLGVYTAPSISGPLLDWVAQGLYGIERPVIVTSAGSISTAGSYDTVAFNTIPFNGFSVSSTSSTSQIANDDIYKRVLTWILYRGDGQQMSIPWMKRRIARFIYGPNGADIDIGLLTNVSINDVPGQTVAHVPTGGINAAPVNRLAVNANRPKEVAVKAQTQLIASAQNTVPLNTSATNENKPIQVNSGTAAKHQLFVYLTSSPIAVTFQRLLSEGILPAPFQINITVTLT